MQESKSGVPIKAMPKPSGAKKKAKIVLGSKKTMESGNSREKITTERTQEERKSAQFAQSSEETAELELLIKKLEAKIAAQQVELKKKDLEISNLKVENGQKDIRLAKVKMMLETEQKKRKRVEEALNWHFDKHESKLDIAFLHAAPSTQDPLSLEKELEKIKLSIKDSECQVKFRQEHGTLQNYNYIVGLAPQVLHISCHGVYVDRNDTLLYFETEEGLENTLHQNMLCEGCDPSQIALIFVAACQSNRIGEMYLKRGVKHVITSEEKKFLDDKYTICFSKALYKNLL